MMSFADKIFAKRFVTTTELTPPKGVDLAELIAKASLLEAHVDAINLTESARARMAISPGAVAHLLLDHGVEPIVQITARDRNRIAIQADILAASVLGVRNFVFMTGDSPKAGDHPDAKGVFDLTSDQILGAARALVDGHDLAGNALRGAPNLLVGATANPGAKDLRTEIENTRRKLSAGAQFLQTQAVFELATLEKFLEALEPDTVPVLAGIIPLKSAKMAHWLNANVHGITVPESVIGALERSDDPETQLESGIQIAADLVRDISRCASGVHLMALGLEARIPDIVAAAGLRRAEVLTA